MSYNETPMEGTALINLKTFNKKEPTALENEIARLFVKLGDITEITSEEYDKVSDQLAKLYKLKEVDSKKRVSSDALLASATNIAGILVITNYEHAHVIASKAISFIMKNAK